MTLQNVIYGGNPPAQKGTYDSDTVIKEVPIASDSTDDYTVGRLAQIDDKGFLITSNLKGYNGFIAYDDREFTQARLNDSLDSDYKYQAGSSCYIATHMPQGINIEIQGNVILGTLLYVSQADSSVFAGEGKKPESYDDTLYVIDSHMGGNIYKVRSR
jgi:hypothetical protein